MAHGRLAKPILSEIRWKTNSVKDVVNLSETEIAVLQFLIDNPEITAKEISEKRVLLQERFKDALIP